MTWNVLDVQIYTAVIALTLKVAICSQVIVNSDLFGPITNSTIVILVQVHNRLTYLR